MLQMWVQVTFAWLGPLRVLSSVPITGVVRASIKPKLKRKLRPASATENGRPLAEYRTEGNAYTSSFNFVADIRLKRLLHLGQTLRLPQDRPAPAAAALPAALAQRPRAPRLTRTQLCTAPATQTTTVTAATTAA